MKIYTRTGDDGRTGLFGGTRVSKADPRVDAYGTVDEANAAVGLARAAPLDRDVDALLARVQRDLFAVGAALAAPAGGASGAPAVDDEDVAAMEAAIDAAEARVEPLRTFVLPGGCEAAARLHLARTVARRAERAVVALAAREPVARVLLRWLNRLSDLLFVLARDANRAAGVPDVPWEGRRAPRA